jgi:hypothetical protein
VIQPITPAAESQQDVCQECGKNKITGDTSYFVVNKRSWKNLSAATIYVCKECFDRRGFKIHEASKRVQ